MMAKGFPLSNHLQILIHRRPTQPAYPRQLADVHFARGVGRVFENDLFRARGFQLADLPLNVLLVLVRAASRVTVFHGCPPVKSNKRNCRQSDGLKIIAVIYVFEAKIAPFCQRWTDRLFVYRRFQPRKSLLFYWFRIIWTAFSALPEALTMKRLSFFRTRSQF